MLASALVTGYRMQKTQHGSDMSPRRWCLALLIGTGVLIASVVMYALALYPVDGVRMAIRLTARTSLVLFVLAFTASSLFALWPSPVTAWLRAERRQFGVAFAFSHFIHAAALVALSQIDPQVFAALTTPASFIAGGIGYVIIVAMFATSFKRVAALVGPRCWQRLHTGGAWFLAAFFIINFGRRAIVMPAMYWPYMALVFAAVALRLFAAQLKSSARVT